MHRAWHIEDVLFLILGLLKRRDLVRLARTCKALWVPATNEIWAMIPCLSVLLNCLPEGYRRPFVERDVERLDYYSAKVRRVHLGSDNTNVSRPTYVDPQLDRSLKKVKTTATRHSQMRYDLWGNISKARPRGSQFLPNLQEVQAKHVEEWAFVPLIGHITGANLSYVRISSLQHKQSESLVRKFLESLLDTSKLEYLFIQDGQTCLIPPKVIEDSPLKQLRLPPRISWRRHSNLIFKPHALMSQILTKNTLDNLSLDLTGEWYTPEIHALSGKKYLASLTQLWLDLTTFMPGLCKHPICAGSWTCINKKVPVENYRKPQTFFDFLDKPRLRLLNIKFGPTVSSVDFLGIVKAVGRNCNLEDIEELAFGGGGYCSTCPECDRHPAPQTLPHHLRKGVSSLLPLQKLRTLRVSLAPNFLSDVLDLELYAGIATGLPLLEELMLGHGIFTTSCEFTGFTFRELVPLHHLAAFCNLLPKLERVQVGTVDAEANSERWLRSHPEWVSPSVSKLQIKYFARGHEMSSMNKCIAAWFPNSKLDTYGIITE